MSWIKEQKQWTHFYFEPVKWKLFELVPKLDLKRSYDDAKKNIILCIWCNAVFMWFIIFHILYIIVAPLCSAFLKRSDFYKALRSEKRGVFWLASSPVRCDWPNTSSVRRKCYTPYRIVMPWLSANNNLNLDFFYNTMHNVSIILHF